MRLYCPSCRAMYDEPDDRYHQSGGNLSCRVCRTPLIPHEASQSFSADVRTQVAEPPSIVMQRRAKSGKTGPVMGGAAGGDGGFAGDGEKTTMLDVGAMGGTGSGRPQSGLPPAAPPPRPPSPHFTTPAMPQPAGQPYGGGYSPPPRPRHGNDDPTHIFEVQRPANPPPPMNPPPQAAPQAPPYQPAPGPPAPAPGPPKRNRQVVIGGAAGSGSTGESLKTQAFDVKVIEDETQVNKSMQMRRDAVPGLAPVQAGAAPGGQVMVGSDFSSAAAAPTHVSRGGRSKGLILGLGGLVLAGVIVLILLVAGVFGGGDGDSGDSAEGGGASATRGSAPGQRADRLLRDLRGSFQPMIAFSGASAARPGYAAGVSTDEFDVTTYWVARSNGVRQYSTPAEIVGQVGESNEPLFLLVGDRVSLRTAVDTLDVLRAGNLHPQLAAGSSIDDSRYYAYSMDGDANPPTTVQLGGRGIMVNHTGWTEPRTMCYAGPLPTDQLTLALDDALGTAAESSVRLSIGPNVDLQTAVNLVAVLSRPGLSFYPVIAPADMTPPTCAQ